MEKEKKPSIRKSAVTLDRLYQERGNYIQQAETLVKEALMKPQDSPERKSLMDQAQNCLTWSLNMKSQIDKAKKDLETAVNATGWV